MTNLDLRKKQAAEKAVEHIANGMTLGLGSGSTAYYAIAAIGEKLARGELKNLRAVPSSETSATQARELGIPLVELDAYGIDVAIDGMDEVTTSLAAIKGLGGALTREKIVANRAEVFILIGDERKVVAHLGMTSPVPVEVIPFGYKATKEQLEQFCTTLKQRSNNSDEAFITDNGNYIFDLFMPAGFDAITLSKTLHSIPGVLDHGLFLNMASMAYIAYEDRVEKLS